MTIEFTRPHKPMVNLPLTAMIDVVFILIFFFMLTTSFLRIESMELLLPSSGSKAVVETNTTTITLRGNDYVKFGEQVISSEALGALLSDQMQEEPGQAFLILVDEQVSMQRMVMVMDLVSVLGGQSVYVRELGK